jgi:hypothetical protein
MRLAVPIGAFCLASCVAQPAGAPQHQPLGLAGRTAGAPQRCILVQPTEAFRPSRSDPHALLYGRGRTIWVNYLGPNCGFPANATLVTEPIGSSHCRGDFVRSFDSFTHNPGTACRLGDFIPYTH